MRTLGMRATLIGGPTVLLELGGLRLLTDPTFDAAGEEYRTPVYTLRKTRGPAIGAGSIGQLDAVLLSHAHHFDNLDRMGHALLRIATRVLTTHEGAERLGPPALGLVAWEHADVPTRDGRVLRITATPARHGPPDGDRGPVIGFALALADEPQRTIYISGDTVWYEGVAEVARRFQPVLAFPFMGAARVPEVGPQHLTFTAAEGVDFARAFPEATIVPLHCDGWEHYSESCADVQRAFESAGLGARLRVLEPGRATEL